MILRQSSVIACLLCSSITPWLTSGFTILPPTPTPPIIRHSIHATLSSTKLHQSNGDNQDEKNPSSPFLSNRQARISLPLLTTLSALFVTTPFSQPANAGIGTAIPFEETRKEKFNGSISNSVVLLRLKSSLRKRGYYAKKAVVGTCKPTKDDLVVSLTREFGDSKLFGLDTDKVFQEFVKESGEYPHALILYGQDVTINPDGSVSEMTGPADFKNTETTILEKIKQGKFMGDVTVLGGIVIHRTKSGGKDAGEDCFLPVSITYVSSKDDNGSVVTEDLFGEVFGDLPTPRQTVVLR